MFGKKTQLPPPPAPIRYELVSTKYFFYELDPLRQTARYLGEAVAANQDELMFHARDFNSKLQPGCSLDIHAFDLYAGPVRRVKL